MAKSQKQNKGGSPAERLLKILEEKPELIDKILEVAEGGEESNDNPTLEEAQRVFKDLQEGKPIELDKGPIVGEVWQGLSVCGVCGKEQKTHTSNPEGLVTQHICSSCQSQMALMKTDEERYAFIQRGLANDFLGAAKAKFRIMLKRFKANRQKEEAKLNQLLKDGSNPLNFVTGDDK